MNLLDNQAREDRLDLDVQVCIKFLTRGEQRRVGQGIVFLIAMHILAFIRSRLLLLRLPVGAHDAVPASLIHGDATALGGTVQTKVVRKRWSRLA